ncbi:hypothetical protein G6F35_017511 [Rhizopus arrhizus]|nr:hypothetical protein G6F35_017511 [Rhizopus arrhizus]
MTGCRYTFAHGQIPNCIRVRRLRRHHPEVAGQMPALQRLEHAGRNRGIVVACCVGAPLRAAGLGQPRAQPL